MTCFRALLLAGLGGSVLLAAGSFWIVRMQGVSEAWMTILSLSPAVFFMSGIAAYRRLFQGLQEMAPTAVSQLVEEIVKTVLGLGLAYWLIHSSTLLASVGALAAIPAAGCARWCI